MSDRVQVDRDDHPNGRAAWDLPYLIHPSSPRLVSVTLDPLPEQRILTDEVEGVGTVRMALGGPHWDVSAGRADSVAHRLPPELSGTVQEPLEGLPDLINHNGNLLFVSSRMREAIEPLLVDFEIIPVRIRRGKKTLRDDELREVMFYWVNTWRRINLVDLEASLFDPESKGVDPADGLVKIATWKNLILNGDPSGSDNLFDIRELYGQNRYCSVEFFNTCRRNGLDVTFNPVILDRREGYNSKMPRFRRILKGDVMM
ncbi:hypothetical protein G5B46_10470 [Caulobacter sp. 602-2]|uniref:Uncharacterized protein n=1 Tax=Caulobacter sp. 602-2 TaxID=2710887 RepID=A0A6G4QWW4_9CAUL|nr:hypothetical protein [Caulobacter sp. 602-2]NGM50031.1 hypothetical protein [Caulobacter sp. 602-2]